MTSKLKRQAVGRFADAYDLACAGGARPPTLVAQELMGRMQELDGSPTPALLQALADAFASVSSNGATITEADQRRWMVAVNKQWGRGSEFRAAEVRPAAL